MGRDRAAYMRAYRKRRATEDDDGGPIATSSDISGAQARIGSLEAEVRHLKRALAECNQRRSPLPLSTSFGIPKPAPKPGR